MELLNELNTIVDNADVCTKEVVLETYATDMSFETGKAPVAVVKTRTPEQVVGIVNIARKHRVPLVPVSSGAPHFLGDTVPLATGAVVVDLSAMQRVIRMDRTNRVAMCEPGVTFAKMNAALAVKGLRLNMPLLPRAGKSVLGSLLDRAPVTMPKYQWDIADPLTCVEVVFGTGDIFRTGSAAGPGSIEEQWQAGISQKEAAGPSSASWYRVIQGAQGTMGIVTWCSMRCELEPKLESPFLVGDADLTTLLEMMHQLVRRRLVNECFILNRVNLAAIMADVLLGPFERIKESLPPWILFYNVAGYDYFPEDRVEGQVKDIAEIADKIGASPEKEIGRVAASDMLETIQAPSREPYWKLSPRGACQDLFFLTIRKKIPGLLKTMDVAAIRHGIPPEEMGIYLQPVAQGTSLHCEFNVFHEPTEPEETGRVKALFKDSVAPLMARGAFFSRPYGKQAPGIVEQNESNMRALQKVKAIVDPGNIMNPGRICF